MVAPICKDCTHHSSSMGLSRCLRTAKRYTDVVTGKKYVFYSPCSSERDGGCGQSGRHFEQRPTLLRWLKALWEEK